MFRVGKSTAGAPLSTINDDMFREYSEAGINYVEISFSPIGDCNFDFKEIKKSADKYGVELWSYHLPFMPFAQIDISKPSLADFTVKAMEELIKKASDAGINKFVIHPSGEPIEDSERAERMACAKKSLAHLADIAAEYGGVIAVENLPRTCLGRNSEEMLELLSAHEALRICFDTNHLLSESHEDFLKNVAGKIITTHVSDYDFVDEMHFLPGEGKIDWQSLIKNLKETGYDGIWLYELRAGDTLKISRSRELCMKDFARNAKELFENRAITLLEREYLIYKNQKK